MGYQCVTGKIGCVVRCVRALSGASVLVVRQVVLLCVRDLSGASVLVVRQVVLLGV